MTSVSTVFTRVQQSVAVGFHRNQRITRAAPVLDEANVRRIRRTKQNRKQNNMKKLMIAAAAAAMVGGAFAGGLCNDEVGSSGCAVYNVKFTLKTLDAKLSKVKGGDCGDDDKCVYLDNATRKIDGIIWDCAATCDTLNADAMNVALWEVKSKMGVGDLLSFDTTNKVFVANNLPFSFINRYSKKANKVQALWKLEDLDLTNKAGVGAGSVTIAAAGFGSFDAKKEIVKSLSGNAVGFFTQALTTKYAECGDPKVVDLCTEFTDWCTDGEATEALAASGTWSVKYNASLSKGTKSLRSIVPSYAQAN